MTTTELKAELAHRLRSRLECDADQHLRDLAATLSDMELVRLREIVIAD